MATSKVREWYRFRSEAEQPEIAEIDIFDFIGDWFDGYWGFGITAKNFLDRLSKLPESVRTIKLRLNSPGGDFYSGTAIANLLRDQQASKGRVIKVLIDGLAASAATIVTSAGSKGEVAIADNAMMFVHNPYTPWGGNAKDLRRSADCLDKLAGSIITAYRWRSPLSEAELAELMDADTLMDADEAIAWGFADEKIVGLPVMAAVYDPRGIAAMKNMPEKLRVRLQALPVRAAEPEWNVGGDRDLPMDDERAWDADAADMRMRKECSSDGSGDKMMMDWPKYRKAHVVYDAGNEEDFGSYKLGFADMVDGKMTAIKSGLVACRAVLNGGRGGVDLPDDVMEKAKTFVDGYLGEQDEEEEALAASPTEILAAVEIAALSTAFARQLIEARLPLVEATARIAEAVEVRGLCAAAKLPELADGYIRNRVPAADVRAQLTLITAKGDAVEIRTTLSPDGDRPARVRSGLNPSAIYAERNARAGQRGV